jgi:hypothetical protein
MDMLITFINPIFFSDLKSLGIIMYLDTNPELYEGSHQPPTQG